MPVQTRKAKSRSKVQWSLFDMLRQLPPDALAKTFWDVLPSSSKQSLLRSCKDASGLARSNCIQRLTVQVVREHLDWLQQHQCSVSQRFPLLQELHLLLLQQTRTKQGRLDRTIQEDFFLVLGVCTKVQSLHLSSGRVSHDIWAPPTPWQVTVQLLAHLARIFPCLKSLSISPCKLADPLAIQQLAKFSTLQALAMKGSGMFSSASFSGIAALQSITSVSIIDTDDVHAQALQHLTALSVLTALTSLVLHAIDCTLSGPLLQLIQSPNIQSTLQVLETDLLRVPNPNVGQESWLALAGLRNLQKLSARNLCVHLWQQLIDLTALTELNVCLISCPLPVDEVPSPYHLTLQVVHVNIPLAEVVSLLPFMPHLRNLSAQMFLNDNKAADNQQVMQRVQHAHPDLRLRCFAIQTNGNMQSAIQQLLPASHKIQHLCLQLPSAPGLALADIVVALSLICDNMTQLERLGVVNLPLKWLHHLGRLASMSSLKLLNIRIAYHQQFLLPSDPAVQIITSLADGMTAAGKQLTFDRLPPVICQQLNSRLKPALNVRWLNLVSFAAHE